MDLLIGGTAFGQLPNIDSAMSAPIKQEPSSDDSAQGEDPNEYPETLIPATPSWQDPYTEFDPEAGLIGESGGMELDYPRDLPPSSRLVHHENVSGRAAGHEFVITESEKQTQSYDPLQSAPFSHAPLPPPFSPEAKLEAPTEYGSNPPTYGESESKMPSRHESGWRDADYQDRKFPARKPRAADFPLQHTRSLSSLSAGPPVASRRSVDSPGDQLAFQEHPHVSVAASVHHASNPHSSPAPPILPQRRSARLKTEQPTSEQRSLPDSSPIAQSTSRFQPRQEEIDAEPHERAKGSVKTWYDRLNDYDQFFRENGHGNVPQKYPPNEKLGIWVNKQRMEYKAHVAGKSSSMKPWKIRRLREANFVGAKPKGQASWESQFQALEKYKRDHGDCHVPTKYKHNKSLGRWVSTQRANYKKFKNNEPVQVAAEEMERRIAILEDLGFSWTRLPSPTGSNSSGSHLA